MNRRVVGWNVGPRSPRAIVRSLRGIRAASDAKVVGLFEASKPALVALLRVRYPHRRVICHRSDVVAILHRRAPQPRVEVVGHSEEWIGPHAGRPHRGRSWLLLVWDDEALLLVHRVPGGPSGGQIKGKDGKPANLAAWAADLAVIRAVVKRWDLPDKLAIIGDHNATADELRDEYADLGLTLLPVTAKVDQCAVRGFKGGGSRLGNHGSDHVAIEWRLR